MLPSKPILITDLAIDLLLEITKHLPYQSYQTFQKSIKVQLPTILYQTLEAFVYTCNQDPQSLSNVRLHTITTTGLFEMIKYKHYEGIHQLVSKENSYSALLTLKILQMIFNTLLDNYKHSKLIPEIFLFILKRNTELDPSVYSQLLLRTASEYGSYDLVDYLLQDKRVDPTVKRNGTLRIACQNGHVIVAKSLLNNPQMDPSVPENEPIQLASMEGHSAIVSMLMKDARVNPADVDNRAIRKALLNQHMAVIYILLQDHRVDPTIMNNDALWKACELGDTNLLAHLLKDRRVDPTFFHHHMITIATNHHQTEIVRMLLKDGRIVPTSHVIELAKTKGFTDIYGLLINR